MIPKGKMTRTKYSFALSLLLHIMVFLLLLLPAFPFADRTEQATDIHQYRPVRVIDASFLVTEGQQELTSDSLIQSQLSREELRIAHVELNQSSRVVEVNRPPTRDEVIYPTFDLTDSYLPEVALPISRSDLLASAIERPETQIPSRNDRRPQIAERIDLDLRYVESHRIQIELPVEMFEYARPQIESTLVEKPSVSAVNNHLKPDTLSRIAPNIMRPAPPRFGNAQDAVLVVYPPVFPKAAAAHAEGEVHLQVKVSDAGEVLDIEVLSFSGNDDMLLKNAILTVEEFWVFEKKGFVYTVSLSIEYIRNPNGERDVLVDLGQWRESFV